MSERRKIVGEKFIDLGNFTVVALIFSQVVIKERDFVVLVFGIGLALFFWMIGVSFLRKERKK